MGAEQMRTKLSKNVRAPDHPPGGGRVNAEELESLRRVHQGIHGIFLTTPDVHPVKMNSCMGNMAMFDLPASLAQLRAGNTCHEIIYRSLWCNVRHLRGLQL